MSRSARPKCGRGRGCGVCGDEGEVRRAREAQDADAIGEVLADREARNPEHWRIDRGPLRGTTGDDPIPDDLRPLLEEVAASFGAEPAADWHELMAKSLSRFTD